MILYYRVQINENGIWYNHSAYSPVAVKRDQVRALIGVINLADNERLVRINQSEAIEGNNGNILFLEFGTNFNWHGKWLTTEKG